MSATMESIPHELDVVRAEIEGLYGIRDRRTLTPEDLAYYDSLLTAEKRLLTELRR